MADANGFQPTGEKIDEDAALGAVRRTTIDVETVAAAARSAGAHVAVSDDAGRFVCNYLYFRSLAGGAPCVFVRDPRGELNVAFETRARCRDVDGPLIELSRRGWSVL